jgi:hypothetical protein
LPIICIVSMNFEVLMPFLKLFQYTHYLVYVCHIQFTSSFQPHYGPGLTQPMREISTGNIPGVKRGGCVRLTTSPPSVVDCLENV